MKERTGDNKKGFSVSANCATAVNGTRKRKQKKRLKRKSHTDREVQSKNSSTNRSNLESSHTLSIKNGFESFDQNHQSIPESSSTSLLPKCDPNCNICAEYILRFTQHIRELHGVSKSKVNNPPTPAPPQTSILTTNTNNPKPIKEHLKCSICSKWFRNPDSFKVHMERHNVTRPQPTNPPNKVSEPVSNQIFPEPNFEEITPPEILEFDEAPRPKKRKRRHAKNIIKRDQTTNTTNDEIELIDLTKKTKPLRPRNLKAAAAAAAKLIAKSKAQIQWKQQQQQQTSHICGICHEKFTFSTGLVRHYQDVHPDSKFIPVTKSLTENLHNDHSDILENEMFECRLCNDEIFSNNRLLISHYVSEHSGEKPYLCKYCKGSFNRFYHLIDHDIRNHNPTRRFKCNRCDKQVKSYVSLNRHIRNQHPEGKENGFSCNTCDLRFFTQTQLSYHKKVHAEDNKCGDCGVCFSSARDLMNHKVDDHPNTRMMCRVCGKKLNGKVKLWSHHKRKHNSKKLPTKFLLVKGKNDMDICL